MVRWRLDVPQGEFRELTLGEVMALERAAAGKKVVPKKRLPEFAQLKTPGVKKTQAGVAARGGKRRSQLRLKIADNFSAPKWFLSKDEGQRPPN
jgi:hypothetical protein